MDSGVPVGILRGIQQAAESMANSADMMSGPNIPEGVPTLDIGRRQSLIQEIIAHTEELFNHTGRQYEGSLNEHLSSLAQNIADQMKTPVCRRS